MAHRLCNCFTTQRVAGASKNRSAKVEIEILQMSYVVQVVGPTRYSYEQRDRRIKMLPELESQFIPSFLKGYFNTKNLLQVAKSNLKFLKGPVISH